jgi:6-phosphofructokinase 1
MATPPRRIAINFGGGYVPGLNAVTTGVGMAASELGWEVLGIRDGFDGLLFPDRYADGGVMPLGREQVEHLSGTSGSLLGTGARSDPFHVRTVNADNQVEELDRSEDLLKALRAREIDGVISVVGPAPLSILLKLSRRGLKTVAVPKSVENDMAATMLSFGFNSALSFAAETIERARQAAESARRIAVVEVLGERAGWLALQAGIATCADAVLIPEIRYDLRKVAARLQQRMNAGRSWGLVVVAEGAAPLAAAAPSAAAQAQEAFRASLSPGASGEASAYVIDRSGHAAERVALELQRATGQQTYPLVLGQLARGGPPTAVDRQLGLAYGAAAVRALNADQSGVMVSFQPPDLKFVPLVEAINKVRVVPPDSVFMQVARSLGISLGD